MSKLNQILSLSEQLIQQVAEKMRFEGTSRREEFENKIQLTSGEFRSLAREIQAGGELLFELNVNFSK
jgi:hypothetical protein